MPEKVMPGPVQDTACIREAVCIHTKKIYDSCKDKDCIEDLRFYPTQNCQAVIDRAISIKAGKAELLYVYIDVEPIGLTGALHCGCPLLLPRDCGRVHRRGPACGGLRPVCL